jgi:Ca2+-binding RTX toxin-like protein
MLIIHFAPALYRQLAIRQGIIRRRKQKQFSSKSLPIVLALVLLFTGLIVVMMTVSVPAVVLVLADNIQGTFGDDTLNGTSEADTINGFEGNDIIFGEGGDDALDGGKGDDEIHGGDGNDEIKDGNDDPLTAPIDYGNKAYGGSGNDNIDVGIDYTRSDFYYVYGEDGADYIQVVSNAAIYGGPDNDTIYCTGYECGISGDEGDDEIHAESYDVGSYVQGGSGNDKLYFNGSGDTQSGGDGNDYLFVDGGGGDLSGGEGDDVLEATGGDNRYNGGVGADTFKCSSGPYDIVEDYTPEEGDTIISAADCETVEDLAPPNVQITQAVEKKGLEVSDGGTTKSRYINITFEVTEGEMGAISSIDCILDGQFFPSCTSPVVYDKLGKGTYEFTVRAWDAIGRFGEDEFTWTIGRAAPLP